MEDAIASILDHVSVSGASRQLGITSTGLSQTIQRLTMVQRIHQASDDAAGLGIRNKLGADIRMAKQCKRNTNDSISYLRVADSVLDKVTRLLTRAAELADRAKTSASNSSNRAHIDAEFEKISSTIHDSVEKTKFNGAAVFTSTAASVPAGGFATVCLTVRTMSSSEGFALGLSGTTRSLTTPADGDAVGLGVSTTFASVSSLQASLGGSLQQLTSDSNVLGLQVENLTAAHSQLRDANLTKEIVNLTKFQILQQSGTSALGQANQGSQQVLPLLRKFQSGRPESQERADRSLPQVAG